MELPGVLLITILILVTFHAVHGFSCHCTYDCAADSNSTCNGGHGCAIYIQSDEIIQVCLYNLFEAYSCTGQLILNLQSSVPYRMCCTGSDFCNSEETFLDLIEEYNSLHQTTTTSPSSSTLSTTTTSTSQQYSTTHITTSTITMGSSTTVIIMPQPTATTSTSYTASVKPSTASNTISEANNQGSNLPSYAIGIIVVLAILLAIFVIVILLVIFLHFYPRHVIGAMGAESDGTPTCTLSTECGELDDNLLKGGFEGTTTGSGSGLPQLIQRSVAAQVTLKEVVGKGRFGEVRKGVYKGDSVAVKIFHTKEEASWNHEVEIYQTCLIRHPNILRFVAADNQDMGIMTQLWLITEYCELGSLYDVLQAEPLSEDIILKLCYTAASGLAHLHSDIIGTEGKPAIAHRDLKTRNILVKSDFSCCLADLGLSLRYYRDTDKVEEPPTKRVGTRRYLSPEILNDSMDINNFDCFKRSDMYSFGLVVWETARRGICAGGYEDYQLPYFDLVNPDPSFEDMRKVVAFDKKRPTIPNRWSQSEVFHGLSQLMEQCWHHDGEARVTALRVKKNLSNLQSAKMKQIKPSIATAT